MLLLAPPLVLWTLVSRNRTLIYAAAKLVAQDLREGMQLVDKETSRQANKGTRRHEIVD